MRAPTFTFPGRQFINFTMLLIGTSSSLLVIVGTRQLLKSQIVSKIHRNHAAVEYTDMGREWRCSSSLSIHHQYEQDWGVILSSKITKDWIVTCSNFGIICSVDMTGAAIFPSHHVRSSHWASSDQSEASLTLI